MSHFKIVFAALACLLITGSSSAQDPITYIFQGSVSNVWTTTGNWTPSYPGTNTTEGEIIIIDAECRASGMNIEIGGGLIINANQRLNISGTNLNIIGTMTIHGELLVLSNGMFMNSGYTTLESSGSIINLEAVFNTSILVIEGSVQNNGQWINGAAGEINLLSLSTFENNELVKNFGQIEDFSSGFINKKNIENNGEFSISGSFINMSSFSNLSTLFVYGNLNTTMGSNLYNHKLLEISAGAALNNSGTTYIFSSAQMNNSGTIINNDNGRIFNQGTISTKGDVNFSLKPGSLLDNRPGSVVTVN